MVVEHGAYYDEQCMWCYRGSSQDKIPYVGKALRFCEKCWFTFLARIYNIPYATSICVKCGKKDKSREKNQKTMLYEQFVCEEKDGKPCGYGEGGHCLVCGISGGDKVKVPDEYLKDLKYGHWNHHMQICKRCVPIFLDTANDYDVYSTCIMEETSHHDDYCTDDESEYDQVIKRIPWFGKKPDSDLVYSESGTLWNNSYYCSLSLQSTLNGLHKHQYRLTLMPDDLGKNMKIIKNEVDMKEYQKDESLAKPVRRVVEWAD